MSRYFFSEDPRDQVVFATAVYPDDHGWRFYRSDDGGRTWNLSLDEGISRMSFSPDYAQDHTVYALSLFPRGSTPYFWRSQDRGKTWQQLPTPADGPYVGGVNAIAIASPNVVFYGQGALPGTPYKDRMARGLFRFDFSDTGAATWEQLSFENVGSITLSPDFAQDQIVFIGEYGYKINGGLKKSTDGGRTWRTSDAGIDSSVYLNGNGQTVASFAPTYPADPLLFAVTDSRYYRSVDGGATWQASYVLNYLQTDIDASNPPGWVFSPNFADDRRAWIEYGKFMTSDAGLTWQRAGAVKMPYLAAREWCEDDRCGVLLVGGQDFGERTGVYKSFDLGRTWQCPDAPTPSWWPNVPPVYWTFAPVTAR